MPLSDRAIAAAKPREKAYRLSDGDGLLLEVRPSGSRTWLCRFQVAGKRRDMGLGPYPNVSLAAARKLARAAGEQARQGVDPIRQRERDVQERSERERLHDERRARTFREVAEALIEAQKAGWTSAKTMASWRLTLDKHGLPAIGDIPVAEVSREHVVHALAPVWTTQPATATKLQRRIAAVLDYAVAMGWRSTVNVATGRVLRLTKALPAQAPGRQQASLPWGRVPAFLAVLDTMEGVAPLCLAWAVHTATRNAEARGARWSELDLDADLWVLPPQRMKGGRRRAISAHRVPVTTAMLNLLTRAAALRTGDVVPVEKLSQVAALLHDALIFPALGGAVLSDMALSAVVRRMNEARRPEGAPMPWLDADGRAAVPHGFRRSFRTWIDDTRPQDSEAAEKALAHDDTSAVRAAYRGSDMLDQRRPLMEAWSEFCTGAKVEKAHLLADRVAGP